MPLLSPSLRRALRGLTRYPASSATAVAMGAIGIALVTLALALADAALWRPLPFPEAHRLVLLSTRYRTPRDGARTTRWSFPRLQHVRNSARTVELASAWNPVTLTLTGRGEPEVVTGEVVSRDFFALLGGTPATGRTFGADEDVAGAPRPVVVLSATLAQHLRLRGEEAAVGASVTLNGVPLTIVGIMRPGFAGLSGGAVLWIPLALAPTLTYPEYLTTAQDFITLIARLAPGRSVAEASREVATLAAAAQRVQPTDERADDLVVDGTAESLGAARVRPEGRQGALLVLAGGALLFLLTLTNLVALLLGRAVARRRETAVAIAIGAPRHRLWGALAAEGTVLVAAASCVALAALGVTLRAVAPLDPVAGLGRAVLATHSALGFDLRVVGWWSLACVVALVTCTGVPAWWTVRHASLADLREGGRGSASTGLTRRRPGMAALILGLEGGIAMLLLATAGQLLVSYRQLQAESVGVDAARVLTFELQPSEARVPPARAPAFIDAVLASLRRVPGVEAASVDGGGPLAGSARTGLHVVGRPDDPQGGAPMVLRHYVGPEHFTTLGIPLLAGRPFTDGDRADAPRVAIISASAARRYFPAGDAIGRRVWFDGSTLTSPDSSAEIVGIVGDVTYDSPLSARTTASFYTPYAQFTYGWRVYFVRVRGEPRDMARAIAEAVHDVAPDLPLRHVRPLGEILRGAHAASRGAAQGTGALAVLGLLLAVCGTWAVVSHATAQRRRDVAIRLAHGAGAGRVMRLVLGEGLLWPSVGLAGGAVAAVAASGALRALLYGVAPGDLRIVAMGAVLFLLSAAGACLLPAWWAARVDPMEVLRGE